MQLKLVRSALENFPTIFKNDRELEIIYDRGAREAL